VSSSQIFGNNGGVAVPVAVDGTGAVDVTVTSPVTSNLYAEDPGGTSIPVISDAAGRMDVAAYGVTGGGVATPLLVDALGRVTIDIDGLTSDISWAELKTAPKLYQLPRTADGAPVPQPLTIQSQAPVAGATGASRNPGNIVLDVPSPAAGGTSGWVSVQVDGAERIVLDRYKGTFNVGNAGRLVHVGALFSAGLPVTTAGAIYMLASGTLSTTNYTVYGDGTNSSLNAPAGGGAVNLEIASSVAWQATRNAWQAFTPTTDLAISVAAKSGNGFNVRLTSQGSSGANGNGGRLDVQGGARNGTGLKGGVRVSLNGSASPEPMVEAAEVSAGQRVVSLARTAALTTTQMPANTGDGVVYLADAQTAPTANPASGTVVYGAAGTVTSRSANGVTTEIAPLGATNAALPTRQWIHRHGSVTTTDATYTTLFTLPMPARSCATVQVYVTGKRGDVEGTFTGICSIGFAEREGVLAPAVYSTFANHHEDSPSSTDWQWAISGNDVVFQVQGSVGETYQWNGHIVGTLSAL
jgi:hypothetical protein